MILILVLWLLLSFLRNFAVWSPYQASDFCSETEMHHMTPWLTSKRTRPDWAVQELVNASRYSFATQPTAALQSTHEEYAERLEMSWTMIPALFILAMLHPSLQLLYVSSSMIMSFLGKEYALEDTLHSSFLSPNYTIKVTGNQWYWTYEYGPLSPEGQGFAFDSYTSTSYEGLLLKKDSLTAALTVFPQWSHTSEALSTPVVDLTAAITYGNTKDTTETIQHHLETTELWLSQLFGHRVLSVLQPICFPVGCTVKMLYTSSDVIHSWSVPSLGGKVDAIPGTVNQQVFLVKNLIVQWGQCYELCGPMHYNMPICVVAVPESVFQLWHAVWSKVAN